MGLKSRDWKFAIVDSEKHWFRTFFGTSCSALSGFLFLLLACVGAAQAGIREAPGEQLEVSLLTYGPGQIYWERFGHDAIEIRDRASGEAAAFNYGMFDFEQKNFLLNFARGHMRYSMDAVQADDDIRYYASEGRSITRQHLNLNAAQRQRLRDYLLWNIQPAHAEYDYNYYMANCATQIRDALDRVLGGQLEHALSARPATLTWRQQTDRLMAAQPWLMLLMDLGLSHYADQPLNAWQAGFIPMELSGEINDLQIANAEGGTKPLVTANEVLARSTHPPPPAEPPDLRVPLLLVGALIAIVLLFAGRSKQRGTRLLFTTLASVWLLLAGLAGLFMLVLWGLTEHQSAWANANLLLFNPLAWLLLGSVWRTQVPTRAHLLAWLMTALAAIALVGNLTELLSQRNLPWILLALPVWLVLLHTLRQRSNATLHSGA